MERLRNLLAETIEILEKHGKTLDDIDWFGGEDFQISREQFIELANIEYDPGYGRQEIANDLILVGKDFWLERHEYDGAEWWAFKCPPPKPPEIRVIHTLSEAGWGTLKQINEGYKNEMG